MDNYFTLSHAIKHLRENRLGVVGSARMTKGWSPPDLHNTQAKGCDFNNFRYLVGENDIMMAKWMYNGLVIVMSTIQWVGECVLVNRRMPCVTVKDKQHFIKVWG
eukprot:10965763-Ditylum_brightwellii.AAC.1